MSIRWFAVLLGGLLGLFSSLAPAGAARQPKELRLPNIVVIYADDLGYGDLGCYGAKGWTTPHLDRMAKEGARFTDFYVAQAVCSASRAALLTGCYSNRVGILGALGPQSMIGLNDKERTIAGVLKPRGYATAIVGKWHLGHHPVFLPTHHGFDDYFGLPYSNDMRPPKYPALPLIEGEKTIETNPDQAKLTARYTKHAVGFIEKNRHRPFFLYMAHAMPHVPLHVSARFAGKSKQGLYGDVIMEIDDSVGQVLAALKKHGVDNDTLVVFTSDNGPWINHGNHAGTTGGLREGKGTAWEGGVRVPCIMRWPGMIVPGVRYEPAMTIDILPTVARFAGARLPARRIDGKDIGPIVLGRAGAKSPHEAYFFYWNNELHAVRSGKWKLHLAHTYRTLGAEPPGKDGKPGVYKQARTAVALYNLEVDSGEKNNVADEHPDVVERLRKLAEGMRDDLGDSLTKKRGKGRRLAGKVE